MIKVLVTGGRGQLGLSIKAELINFPEAQVSFADFDQLDISNQDSVNTFFSTNNFDFCINCAAFTSVDLAEEEQEKAYLVNTEGAKNVAVACSNHGVILVHISTDFVFDGLKGIAYSENDETIPLNVYGQTKRKGEKLIKVNCPEHIIIRTSWLYSEFGNNFMKTVLRLIETKNSLTIVDDQIGTPTYARDLANAILIIVSSQKSNFGIYHYSNEGVASWYDFALAIADINPIKKKVTPVKSSEFKTLARRPHFSVLDKTKIKDTFKISIPHWRESLQIALYNEQLRK